VAKADGRVEASERAVLDEVAAGIEVDASLVERTLSAQVRLD
jgi:tellurite resistance protein